MIYLLYVVIGFFVSMKFGEFVGFFKSFVCGYALTAIIFLMIAEAW